MKKLLFAVLFTASLATTAFAKETTKVNYRVERNFQSQFSKATNVTWSLKDNFAKAKFVNNGENMEVFYDLNGEMIGTSKNVSYNEIPAHAKRKFSKLYNGYSINEVIHFDAVDGEAYYISAENEKESVVLKVTDSKDLAIIKTERKK